MSATLQSFGEAAATLQSSGEETAASTKTEGEELGAEFEEHYALADFTAEDASQVSFMRGDKVFVKTKDQSGKIHTYMYMYMLPCSKLINFLVWTSVALYPGPFPYCMLKLDHLLFLLWRIHHTSGCKIV